MTTVATAAAFALAAAAGALARAEVGRRFNQRDLPLGTFVVNVTGSFVIGLLAGLGKPLTTIVCTGFLGAYTTVSSFARDAVALGISRRWWRMFVYVAASSVCAVLAAWLGLTIV